MRIETGYYFILLHFMLANLILEQLNQSSMLSKCLPLATWEHSVLEWAKGTERHVLLKYSSYLAL